jgi:acyl-CoA dehydrogenase
MQRGLFGPDHDDFRDVVRAFLEKEVVPEFAGWQAAGAPPRDIYRRLAEVGISNLQIPEEYGGGGQSSFLFNVIVTEECIRAGANLGSLRVHMDVVLPYFLGLATPSQRERWLPGIAAGDIVLSIAMTEPRTGSDLAAIATTARRDGDELIINGQKTFITGGRNADLVLVVARTSPSDPGNRRSGLSLVAVEANRPGFSVGNPIGKIGLKSQDTVELFFDDVRVPADNLVGEEGRAFEHLTGNLPQERLTISVVAVASAREALRLALDYTADRTVFGASLASFQNTKFVLADCATQLAAGEALIDRSLGAHERGELSPTDAAKVKLFTTEMQARVVDACLQLHGGYGFADEYPIAQLYADARVTRIYGGTSEVMKSIIAKSLR